MSSRLQRYPGAGWLALLGAAFVAVVVPLAPGRETIAGIPLDAIILTVPIAVLLAVPVLTRAGAAGIPRVGVETPALLFLGWALLSAIMTGAQPSVIATWVRYAGYIGLIYAAAAVATDPTRRRILLWLVSLSGSVTVAHGFLQYVRPAENIGMAGLDARVATRIFATFDNPNFYAEFLVLLFAVSLALLFVERGPLRYLAAFLLAAQAIALLLTYTRGSWLALAIGIVVGLLMIDGRLVWPFAAGAVALVPLVPGVWSRIASLLSLEGTASFRLRLWEVAGTAMAERPLFGVGLGRFYDAFAEAVLNNPQLNIGYLLYGAHNSLFQLGAEIGIPGMLAFAWLVVECCRMGAYYNSRMGTQLHDRLINAALTVGLVAFAINSMTSNAFQHPRGAVFFFLLAGVQAGLGAPYWDAAHATPDRAARRANGTWSQSALGRALATVGGVVRSTWTPSLLRRALLREPEGGGRLLSASAMARWLFGSGSADEDRAPA